MKKLNPQNLVFLALAFTVSSCALKMRSEVNPSEQNVISRRKQQEIQKVENSKGESQKAMQATVDTEETIRALNGRIEVLENQVAQLTKDNLKLSEPSADSAKITALQEALSKMELQLQKIESNQTANEIKHKSSDDNLKTTSNTGDTAPVKKNSFEIAEELFGKKEWKKAILSYQKFAEEFPKSKLVPEAKYKTGLSFQELGLKDEALAFYEEVSVQYPQTAAGKKAKNHIAQLSKTTKTVPKAKKK